MTSNANHFKLGLFVISAILLGALFLIIFGAGAFFKNQELVETYFNESVQGLNVGSEVKYKGIRIGTVQSIQSASRVYRIQSDYVLVVIALEESVSLGQTGRNTRERLKKAIDDGLVIRLSFKGLTGAAYLETDYLPGNIARLQEIPWSTRYPFIPSQKSNMKQYGDALNQILDNLSAINIKGITTDLGSLLNGLNQKVDAFDPKGLISKTEALVQELTETTRKISSALDSKQFDRLMEDIGKAAASVQATTSQIENLTWVNSDKISNTMENLETASENLKQISHDLRRYPGRILFEKPPEKIVPEEAR